MLVAFQLILNDCLVLNASVFSAQSGGQEEYILSYETVMQQEGKCLTQHV